ncbi:hypothetical protein VP395_11345 [Mariniflexile soesokkakense]|uniref:Uncharacterized protein n=1 Tax=Mariniflexile soesokkakense TaxID=1343160 RepID=A0ABV0AB45_9FLAO
MLRDKLYDYKVFWVIKGKFKSLKLKYNILRFRASNAYFKEREKFSLGKAYLSEISINIIRAILFVGFLYIIEHFTQDAISSNYTNLFDWFKWVVDTIPKPSYPDGRDSVNGYVSFIASVSGLLLALFYPILATIASTGYANVNSSLRNLLFAEPVTQNYLRELAFLTAYSLLTLLLIIFGFNPGNLILIILSVLALRSLFSLLKLGAGVYNLFEPKTLSKILNKDIVDNVKNVTVKGVYWYNINFQDYFRRKSEKKLKIIRLVNELSLEGVLVNNQSLLDTITQTFNLLNVYLTYKNQIPTDSKWFKGKDYHKSYFETGAENRQLSVSTSTYVQPEHRSNLFWFEEEILKIYEDIGIKVLPIENENIKQEYLAISLNTLRFLGHSFEYDLANKLLVKNLALTTKSLDHQSKSTYDDSKSNLILIETFLYGLRNFQINFFERIEFLTKEEFNGQISKINWTNKASVYKLNLPTNLYSYLEKYFENIKNERLVENLRVTPDWYIVQHISAEYLLAVNKIIDEVITQIKTFAFPLIDNCKENNNPLLLSFTSHIILELIEKVKFRLPRTLNVLEGFETNNLYKGAFKWTSIDDKQCINKLDAYKNEIMSLISNNMSQVAMVKWNENYPDVFARSYSIISNEIGRCLYSKDIEGFKSLVPDFIKASIISFHTLYQNFKEKYSSELEINHQVHLELMQICGISYIYTKLTGIPFWDIVVEELDKIKWTETTIRLFTASYLFVKSKLGININWNENQLRQTQLRKLIENENINIEDYKEDIVTFKYIYSSSYHKNEYEEIFMDMYLLTFIESKEWAEKLSNLHKRDLFDMIVRRTKTKDE